MRWMLLLVGLSGCFVDSRMLNSPSLSAQRNSELRAASKLLPAPLVQPRAPAPRQLIVLKVRAWADASYRRRLHWREHLKEIVASANEFLGPAVGVALEIDPQPWEREGDGEDLAALLDELERKDPGDDVDHVLGLTGALPRFSSAHEMLGRALTPGKHFVMRALNNGEELKAIAEALPTLSRKELDQLSSVRLAHKEIAVFVHEWAHNLGALHEDGREMIMGPGYNHEVSHFSDANRELVALSVRARRGDETARAELVRHVSSVAYDGWHPSERQALLSAFGGGRVSAGVAGMRPVIQPAPGATRVDPGERLVALDQALSDAAELQEGGKLRAALDALDAAQVAATSDTDWMRLAQAYMALGAYQRALAMIAKGATHKQAEEYRQQVLLLARQRGLYGVPAEEEPEANAAIEKAHEALSELGAKRARKLVADGLKRWKGAAGLLALRCAVELDGGNVRAAEASCARAVAAGDEAVMAHYYSGHAAWRARRRDAAAAHFERVIDLDPDAQAAYEALATIYQDAGRKDKLDALRAAHLRRFKRSL